MSQLSKQTLLVLCKTLGINVPSIKYKSKEQLKKIIKDYEDTKNTKVLCTGKKVKHIYHSADIHIRTLERHNEYKGVFENLVNYLKQQPEIEDSVFVICGDIFHNRDRLISETIILFNSFIEKLTAVLPVIMIPGNHDIFSHTDRMDTISGIVNIRGYNNFYFLKYSGIYCYHNINFVVSSLVDNKLLRINDIQKSELINIALYHGSLSGSKLDNDFTVPSDSINNVSIKDFAGFDYTLLGDIHKRQFLTPDIAYPGSLIQQNFKEEQSHGIIHWNLETKQGKFVDIPNDYSYITLKVSCNEIQNNEIVNFTKYSRVKLIHSYNEDINYEKIKKDISKNTNVLSISKEILNEISSTEDISNSTPVDIQTQLFNKLISKYNCEQKESLTKLHIEYLEKFVEKDTLQQNSVSWYITSLEFQNVYMYGEDHVNTLNFEDKQGVIGILQSNAAGKSSIMNVIMYTLFGHITKNKSFLNRNIINKKSNHYYIKMVIKMGDTYYTIYRKGKNKTRKDKSLSMEEKIEFTCVENSVVTNLTETDKVTTQEKIKATFGLTDKELYTLTNVVNYSMYISLLNMTSSDISLVFSKLFNLEHFKQMNTNLLKETKTVTDKIKMLKSKKEELEKILTETVPNYTLQEITDQQTLKNKELEVIELKCAQIIKQEALLKDSFIEKPEYILEEEELRKQLKMNVQIKTSNSCLTLNEINRKIKEIKIDPEAKKISTFESLDSLLEKKNKITFHKVLRPCTGSEYIVAEKFIKSFNFGGELLFETTKDGEIIIKQEEAQKFHNMYNLFKDTNLLKKYTDTSLLVKEYINYTELIKVNNELKKEQERIDAQINYYKFIELSDLENCKLRLEILDKLNTIDTYKKNIEDLQAKKELQSTRKTLETEKKEILQELKVLTEKETKIKLYNEQQINTHKKISEIDNELITLHSTENLYKIYKSIINDKALPKLILSNTIKQVEREANKLIYSLAGLIVNITTENEIDTTKWEIIIKKNNTLLGSEQVSGYERFVINVGLKMALDKYKFYSGSRIFFIDEAFDCVSEENLDKIDQLFDYLKTYYKHILIISHNEELKKKIDYRINIETDFVCSKVNF
jgi:DNA repair exonuclease SbcCD ATPase subunit/DNA repair exonuclease SbcCD nuclease subunit